METTCNHSCTNHPLKPQANPDITGLGVSLAWTITAGFAVCLVVAYYFTSYTPDIDPFTGQKRSLEHGSLSKSNPIDECFLRWRLKKDTAQSQANPQKERVRNAFTQCMLLMSDVQLFTGLSVLVSGYLQLKCGVSMLHWERIIDVAWLSSITHLSCLTFLRDCFCQERRARTWRIPAMVILVILLCVALIPSAQYVEVWHINPKYPDWNYPQDAKVMGYDSSLDHAICFFRQIKENQRYLYYQYYKSEIGVKRQRAILSAIILTFNMINRVWRLYKTSTDAYLLVRRWCSYRVRRILRWVYTNTKTRSVIVVGLVYRPLLAIFLVLRLIIDLLLSKLFEIWWLIVSLAWGATNLYPLPRGSYNQEWTFSQVLALAMLAAPIVATIDTYVTNVCPRPDQNVVTPETPSSDSTYALSGPSGGSRTEIETSVTAKDDPDFGFYGSSETYTLVVFVFVMNLAALSLLILLYKTFIPGDPRFAPLAMLYGITGSPNPMIPVYFIACTLCTLSIDQHIPKAGFFRYTIKTFAFLLYSSSIILTHFWGTWMLLYMFGTYPLLLVVEWILTKRRTTPSGAIALTSIPVTTAGSTSNRPSTSESTASTTTTMSRSILPPPVDTTRSFPTPPRQDTEAELGVVSPRRPWRDGT